jgi:type II secretory pathway pseudopilin PulG
MFLRIKKDQKGMTLVELMTISLILVLVSGVLSITILRTFYVNKYTIEQGINNSALQSSLRNLSKNIREARQSDSGAYLLKKAGDFDMVFYADLDNDGITEKAHYFLEDEYLKRGVSKPSGFPLEYPEGDEQVKTVAGGIINTAEEPLFYYYNKDYPIDQENNPLTTPASVEAVGLIKIFIRANITEEQAPNDMEIETFVKPRNIKL